MAVAYSFLRIISGKGNGFIPEVKKLQPEKALEYLVRPGVMKDEYLGACLDSCRLGSMTTCYWPTNVEGIMKIIQSWRNENGDNPELYHERKIEDMYTKFELPWIEHEGCPRDKHHKKTILDAGGNIRCAEVHTKLIKPEFIHHVNRYWDYHSQMPIQEFYQDAPNDPGYEDDYGEWTVDEDEEREFLRLKDEYENAPEEEVRDVCYTIISENRDNPMAFETILRRESIQPEIIVDYCDERINGCKLDKTAHICHSHRRENKAVEFCFDGWTLAYYYQKWREQGDDAPWLATKKEHRRSRTNLRIFSEE